jgi:hypothetical protein
MWRAALITPHECEKGDKGKPWRQIRADGILLAFLLYSELPAEQFKEIAEKVSVVRSGYYTKWIQLVKKLSEDFDENLTLDTFKMDGLPQELLLVLNRELDIVLAMPDGPEYVPADALMTFVIP